MRKKNIRNKTYCHIVSDFKDKFSLGGFPFHAIPGLARRQSVYALVGATGAAYLSWCTNVQFFSSLLVFLPRIDVHHDSQTTVTGRWASTQPLGLSVRDGV